MKEQKHTKFNTPVKSETVILSACDDCVTDSVHLYSLLSDMEIGTVINFLFVSRNSRKHILSIEHLFFAIRWHHFDTILYKIADSIQIRCDMDIMYYLSRCCFWWHKNRHEKVQKCPVKKLAARVITAVPYTEAFMGLRLHVI